MDQTRLQEALLKKEDLILSFKKRGISQIIIENTVNDLERRRLRYLNNEGTDGLYESDEKWLNLLLDEKMISLNGFRFQIFPMDYQEIEREGFDYLPMSNVTKEKFPSNLMCLNVHIPDGVDLGRHQIFDEARTFYKIHYPEYDFHYFVIRSWLVYPGMKKILQEDSRIIQFMELFEVEEVSHTNKIQGCSRIFGTEDMDEINLMDKQTSLQRNAYESMDALGVGFASMKF